MSYSSPPLSHLASDLDALQARCALLADTSFGLSMIFGALAVVSAGGGVWLREPLLATSAGFALAATAAFAVLGEALTRACVRLPRVQAVATVPAPSRRA
jgi:hypothetical protein